MAEIVDNSINMKKQKFDIIGMLNRKFLEKFEKIKIYKRNMKSW